MLAKAGRSKDLGSYSLGSLALSNAGNVVHSVYVFSLPPGPLWVLHTFYVIAALLMLMWYLRYQFRPEGCRRSGEPMWTGHSPRSDQSRSVITTIGPREAARRHRATYA